MCRTSKLGQQSLLGLHENIRSGVVRILLFYFQFPRVHRKASAFVNDLQKGQMVTISQFRQAQSKCKHGRRYVHNHQITIRYRGDPHPRQWLDTQPIQPLNNYCIPRDDDPFPFAAL